MRIILPKGSHDPTWDAKPLRLFFLAGPVRGGGDWQFAMCKLLQEHMAPLDFYVAVPCRWGPEHPSRAYLAKMSNYVYDRQLTWERSYLEHASQKGCIIFWLPCESTENPHPGPEPYAMDTRGELGEWRGRMIQHHWTHSGGRPRVVIGAEKEFLGLSQIERNFRLGLGKDFPIYCSMEETATAAVTMST